MLPKGKSQKRSPSSYSWADRKVFWAILDYKTPKCLNFRPIDFKSQAISSTSAAVVA